MRRNTRDVLGAGLVGYLVGKRRLHPIRAALWLVLVWLCVAALGIALLAYYWHLVVLVLAVGAVVVFVRHRRRRQQPTWPTSPPPWGSARQAPSRTGPAQRQLPPHHRTLSMPPTPRATTEANARPAPLSAHGEGASPTTPTASEVPSS